MSLIPVPGFDEILQNLLLDYRSQVDASGNPIDTTPGSAAFIDSSVLASALQGIYYRISASEGWALPSIGQSSKEALELWCSVFGISRFSGESDAELFIRLSLRINEPPAGGKESDWISWAVGYTYAHENGWSEVVIGASVEEHLRGAGSVDLFVQSRWSDAPEWAPVSYPKSSVVRYTVPKDIDPNSVERLYEAVDPVTLPATPSNGLPWKLCGGASISLTSALEEFIEKERRALGIWDNCYLPCEIEVVPVHAVVDQIDDSDAAASEISGMIGALEIGQPLSHAQIIASLVSWGAYSVHVQSPVSDMPAMPGVLYIAGAITVTVG